MQFGRFSYGNQNFAPTTAGSGSLTPAAGVSGSIQFNSGGFLSGGLSLATNGSGSVSATFLTLLAGSTNPISFSDGGSISSNAGFTGIQGLGTTQVGANGGAVSIGNSSLITMNNNVSLTGTGNLTALGSISSSVMFAPIGISANCTAALTGAYRRTTTFNSLAYCDGSSVTWIVLTSTTTRITPSTP